MSFAALGSYRKCLRRRPRLCSALLYFSLLKLICGNNRELALVGGTDIARRRDISPSPLSAASVACGATQNKRNQQCHEKYCARRAASRNAFEMRLE